MSEPLRDQECYSCHTLMIGYVSRKRVVVDMIKFWSGYGIALYVASKLPWNGLLGILAIMAGILIGVSFFMLLKGDTTYTCPKCGNVQKVPYN